MTVPRIHPSLQLSWVLANREAHFSGSSTIEPIHFLVALLLLMDDYYLQDAKAMGMPNGVIEEIASFSAVARKIVAIPDVRITAIRRELTKFMRRVSHIPDPVILHRSSESRALFQDAAKRAADRGHDTINLVHLLEALLERIPPIGSAKSGERFISLVEKLRSQVKFSSVDPPGQERTGSGGRTSFLDELGRDLTSLARSDRLPPVVGRKKEITTLARYLLRTTKRNVLIIGEAGVGKTAIVEGFVQKIATGRVPEFLQSLRVIQINVSDLVAGTQHRGDMESRIKHVIQEATGNPNVVLFLDEIHLIVKAGSGGGAPMDIAAILKPALSRDDFRCIGATTVDEFERHIKGDVALLRRFQILKVPEPTKDEALQMCAAWARRVERLQDVVFAEETVSAAVELSMEFIRGRSLPDKAIDLLENAAVLVKISSLSGEVVPMLKTLPKVKREHIVSIIEEQYGVTVNKSEFLAAEEIKKVLQKEIIGQDLAIAELTQEIVAIGSKTEIGEGPVGVFLFTGPTGTGKTFTAECLGKAVFRDDRNAVIRFNMNEFKERHEIARLIGAPPGFVGHDQLGALFKFAEGNSQGLIILDEMEKAHPEIQDYFLQIFDKGEAQDSRGRKVDLRPYIFVMTCNLVTGPTRTRIGFGAQDGAQIEVKKSSIQNVLSQYFRNEFLARIRRIIEFQKFGQAGYFELLRRSIVVLVEKLEREHSVSFQMTDTAKSQFTDICIDQTDGCRGFKRLFDRHISIPVLAHVKDHSQTSAVTLVEVTDDKPLLQSVLK